MRLRHSSSPLGSTGSSNESWPLSKDEYAEMYSPSYPNHGDDNRNSSTTEEERDNVSDEDDQVIELNLTIFERFFNIFNVFR